MSQLITIREVEQLVEHLNIITGNPVEYSSEVDGRWVQNEGHYYVQHQTGGYRLEQLCKHGAKDITSRGIKREVYNSIHYILKGIDIGKQIS